MFRRGKFSVCLPCIKVKLKFCHDADQIQTFLFFGYTWHQLGVRVLLKCSTALLVNSWLDLFCDTNHDHLYYFLTIIIEKTLRKMRSMAFAIWLLWFHFYVRCITACAWPQSFYDVSFKRVLVKYFSVDRAKCFSFIFFLSCVRWCTDVEMERTSIVWESHVWSCQCIFVFGEQFMVSKSFEDTRQFLSVLVYT